jgi:DNA polymerase-4
MPEPTRAIIHLDLDAFYAGVEILENPALAGKPVLIGGHPEGRGVVAAASYAARAFGVRSAMPMARALVLCPQAVILPARFSVYSDYSRRVMDILRAVTPLFEQMSIDEAYLDVTEQTPAWEAAVDLAPAILILGHRFSRLSVRAPCTDVAADGVDGMRRSMG